MSSTFKFHSTVGEVVPWNATYAFPTQSTQVAKTVVKIPAKNGDRFTQGQILRIELPAEGYLNPQNSVLKFDLTLTGTRQRLQRGGAHNVIKRLRIMYGSMVLEDIQDYKTLVRLFTEAGIQDDYQYTNGAVLEGMTQAFFREVLPIGGAVTDVDANEFIASGAASAGTAHTHKVADVLTQSQLASLLGGKKRTYCLNLLSGLLTTKKLIPLKWMASQLALEITLSAANDALLTSGGTEPTFTVDNPSFIAELVEFDSSYDKAFYMGLQQGIPIKFSSWHTHRFAITGASQTFQIHERSRSVKAAFAVVKEARGPIRFIDSDYFFHALGHYADPATGAFADQTVGPIQEFQWRVGGRYYPSQPVSAEFGGAEAFVELMKTVNYLGNHTVASSITPLSWSSYHTGDNVATSGADSTAKNIGGCGTKFIMACEFENTDVMPDQIAGINAEEQSDIALTIKATASPGSVSPKELYAFVHYDALLIVKTGNAVELVM